MGKIPTDLLKNIFGGEDFLTIEELLTTLKKFKIKQKDYFEDTFPRRDLLTGEKIEYKNIENYFNSDFVNKNNLKKFLKQNPEGGKSWSIEYLKNRKEEKNLIYSPSQAELRSLFCPSIPYFESVGGYNEICAGIGYKNRYDYKKELVFNKLINPTIIIDTREKLALKLVCKSEVGTLKIGDYALKDSKLSIFIDRKSLSDFIQTLSKGYERFQREIERAVKSNSYIIMQVESDINSALGFEYLPHIHSKATSAFIFKRLRDLLTKYPNHFQVVFADGRIDAAKLVLKIFELGSEVKNIDLQYRLEKGELV